ncbi:hypothetical protein V8B55DRAFT_1520470 [Mucor lusitanicus]|uniref:Transcription factor domain-containing protein n=1 Tax=Mucor circinelloides f. lusitanicus TaxID=29924 RepID=A0A8H4BB62_MUCCL|nr:hypothetical protein FB192DRAFT_1394378 [Mucor lusitanicus]
MIATRYYDPFDPFGYNQVSYVIHNFSDLCDLLEIHVPDRSRNIKCTKATVKALLAYKSQNSLPKTIQYHSGSSQLVQGLMYRAIQHWCCISFKIVPIELELIKNNTPKTILYCVAAISIATISTQQQPPIELDATAGSRKAKTLSDRAMDGFKKDIAFCFYKRACHYLQEVIFPDDEDSFSVVAIQCYFCLSYTANLLRLPGEQRTWHYLACDMMKSNVSLINESPALRQCWYRWYYIDAWIAIALNQECLLPDRFPFAVKRPAPTTTTIKADEPIVPHSSDNSIHGCCIMSNDTLYEFVIMTQFMRRFNRAIQAGTLPLLYDRLTFETENWWRTVNEPNLHLRICYFSMRLVILFSLLQHDAYHVDFDLLLDGLNITLEVLQGLQNLKLMNCDQSTYHHMFFAVHQTLKQILVHIKMHRFHALEAFAKQQFEMDLCILEGTDAFRDDIYQMREIAANIESDLIALGYIQENAVVQRSLMVFRAKITPQTIKRAKKSH